MAFEDLFKNRTQTTTPTKNIFEGLFAKKIETPTIKKEVKPLGDVLGIDWEAQTPTQEKLKAMGFVPAEKKKDLGFFLGTPEGFEESSEIIKEMGKAVFQGIMRSGASVALTTIAKGVEFLAPKFGVSEKETKQLADDIRIHGIKDNPVAVKIFGEEPLKAIETRIAEAEISIKEKGVEVPFKGQVLTPEQVKGKEFPLAVAGIGAMIVLDFTGWGGGKKGVIQSLTKFNKVDDVVRVLKKINVADDIITDYAPALAKMNKADDVAKAVNRIEELQKTTKVAPKIAPEAPKIVPKAITVEKGILPKAKGFDWTERGFIKSVKSVAPEIEVRVGGQYVPRSTDRLAIKARTLINENITTAVKIARTGTDDKAVAISSELIKRYTDDAVKATSQASKDALYEQASEIAHITAKNLTEQGRTIQAASIMGRQTPEGIIRFAAREINKYNESLEGAIGRTRGIFGLKKKIPQLTPQQTEELLTEARRIEKMPDGIDKSMAFHKLNDRVANLVPSSWYQRLIAVWKAGLLTGIKTSGLNTMSNLFHGKTEVIKDIPAVAVDKISSLFTGKRSLVFTTKGMTRGIVDEGVKKGMRYLRTGFDERNMRVKFDRKLVNFGEGKFAKGVQTYEESIFRLMGAEDQPFYYGAKARSLFNQAGATAQNKGLKGTEAQKFINNLVQNPTDEMLRYAAGDAQLAVFQNETMLGRVAKGIQKIPGGEVIVPFGRTPSAVANQLVNYSPVGIVKAIAQNIGKGRFDQRIFSQAMGRGITGTGIMYIGSELYKKGMMVLDWPSTEKEREQWKLEGKAPNSIKIGDKYRNVNVLGPAGMVLLVGGHFQESLDNDGSFTKALVESSAGGLKSLSEQTFLKGINEFASAITDPERGAFKTFSNLVASVIPTIISDWARAFDPSERRTEGIFDKLKARVPFVRQTLEPQITVLGEEKKRAGNFLETMIDPSRPSKDVSNFITDEFARLFRKGFSVTPSQLGTTKGFEGLTPQENTALWTRAGEIVEGKLSNLFNSEAYNQLEDDERADKIKDFVSKSYISARVQMALDLTEGLMGQELYNKISGLKRGGLMIRTVHSQYMDILSDEAIESLKGVKIPTDVPVVEEGEKSDESTIDIILRYADAIKTDPLTAFHRLFNNQRIRRIDNDTIIIERNVGTLGDPTYVSTKIREEAGIIGNDTIILDHTIPIQLGGSDSRNNLKLISNALWRSYTPVENYLGRLLRAGDIDKKTAQGLIRDLKEERKTAEEIYNMRF